MRRARGCFAGIKNIPTKVVFPFGSSQVTRFAFGIAGFDLQFAKNESHAVRNFNIDIRLGAPVEGGNVPAWVDMQLEDSSRHDASTDSFVDVVCLATSDQDGALILAPRQGPLTLGSNVAPQELPIPLDREVHAFLSGFRFAWGYGDDHQVRKIRTEVEVDKETGKWLIYGEAGISTTTEVREDSKKLSRVEARAIGTSSLSSTMVIPKPFKASPGLNYFTLDFKEELAAAKKEKIVQAECVICDFSVYFKKGDHHIYGSRCGALSPLTISGSKVSGHIYCEINGRNGTTDPDSSVNVLILAVPGG